MSEPEFKITHGEITDRNGHGHGTNVTFVDGFGMKEKPEIIKVSVPELFKNIRDMKLRNDDILMAAYSKAGTHWLWEVIHMLIGRTTNYQKNVKEKQMLEITITEEINDQPSPRVLNTHLWNMHLPKQVLEKKTKIFYMYRNPKDTCVSLYFHLFGMQKVTNCTGTLSDFLDQFLHRQMSMSTWFEYTSRWEKFIESSDHPIFVLSYEQMTENPKLHVQEVAKFLDIDDVSDELIEAIVEKCSFKNLKKASDEMKEDFTKDMWLEGQGMYRKGKVGDWKNYFTVAENEEFDKVLAEKLKDSKLKFQYV